VHWPFFGLRVRTVRLELRYPSDADLLALADLAAAGIHDPDTTPFVVPWTDAPAGELERGLLQYLWGTRATLRPDDWNLELAVVHEGRVVGTQGLRAGRFAARRTVTTGSWLGRAHQGQGLGREMRAAVLDLVFHGLGAEAALSGAFADNVRSRRLSLSLGYRFVEARQVQSRGVPRDHHQFRLERADWLAHPHLRATWEGLEACLPLLGAPAPGGEPG
jgi:RimJ/RimL family protein N-acetyltransferase